MDHSLQTPLSNIQVELLKLFSANVSEELLLELKNIIAKFLLEKARDRADTIWDERGYTEELLQQLLNKQ